MSSSNSCNRTAFSRLGMTESTMNLLFSLRTSSVATAKPMECTAKMTDALV